MRLVDYRRVARRRRPLAIVTALGLGLAVLTTVAVAATAVNGPVLDYSAYVGGKGKAKANLSPVVWASSTARVGRRTSTSRSRRASSRPR